MFETFSDTFLFNFIREKEDDDNQGPHSDVGPRQKTYSSKQYMYGTDVYYANS